MKKIVVLGSTGSIGKNALRVAEHLRDEIEVVGLAAKSNIDLLEAQARQFHPKIIAIFEEQKALELGRRLPDISVVAGMEGLKEVASYHGCDFVLSAISGTMGILPTIAAIESGKSIGLANKEVLVSAGQYVMNLVREKGVALIPIDSEHNALFQCLQGEDPKAVRRLILTASGGPFRQFSDEQLSAVSLEQALCHPTYLMGHKNTVDSSTLMNKGLEVIEAHFLFAVPVEKIEVVVHPQSILHSMVEFIDGSMMAQMSVPNMIFPIQYALTYPKRKQGMPPPFDFVKNSHLEFFVPDMKKFSCLALAFEALREGGTYPCYMNAANEVLVNRFLNREISWREIAPKLARLMEMHQSKKELTLENILSTDAIARNDALTI